MNLTAIVAAAAIVVASIMPVPAHAAPAPRASGTLQLVATITGEPDDLAVDARGHLVWGNLAHGTVESLVGGRITTLASGLSMPEGVVPMPGGALAVAEQGRDRIVRIDARGRLTVLYALVPVPGQEGVDGIGRDPRTGDLLVPDSPRGAVLRVSADGRRARTIARGLGRPVGAALDARGDILVPDEHLRSLIIISPRGHVSRVGSLPVPDDVAVDRAGRIWVTTLDDGGLWLIAPGSAPRRVLVGLANPQGLALDRCGNPLIVQSGNGHIDRLQLSSVVGLCPFG